MQDKFNSYKNTNFKIKINKVNIKKTKIILNI